MPSFRHHDFGNLYIHFDVKFPERIAGPDGTSMTPEMIAGLESILPPRKVPDETPPSDAMVEDFTLEDATAGEGGRSGGQAFDEEDDDLPPGAERVQCASQ
jgi:DnaJ family protein A protein 2